MNLNWFFPTTNSENEWCKTFLSVLSTANTQQLLFSWYLTRQLISIFLWEIHFSFIYTFYLHFKFMQRVSSGNIVWCNPLMNLELLKTSSHNCKLNMVFLTYFQWHIGKINYAISPLYVLQTCFWKIEHA